MTLTKHQRYTRKLAKLARKDVRYHTTASGSRTPLIGRRKLCVRVSREAAERLKREAGERGLTQQALLTRMLVQGLPRYSSQVSGDRTPHHWDEELLTGEGVSVRQKTGGAVQLNLWVSSTAHRKLRSHRTATRMSAARIVQQVILAHRFLTPKEIAAQREYQLRMLEFNREWRERQNRWGRELADLRAEAGEDEEWED
jgi:hypothetical protein